MNFILLYMLKSITAMGMFYLVYKFVLSRETFFKLNRAYLVISALIAAIMPFFNFSDFINTNEISGKYIDAIQAPIYVSAGNANVSGNIFNRLTGNPLEMVQILFWTISTIVFVRFIFRIVKIMGLIRNGKLTRHNKTNLITLDERLTPFSFFNNVFIGKENFSEHDFEKILAHETSHSKQYHTLDLLLFELLLTVQWFNPFMYGLKKSLVETHEFLADEEVLNSGFEVKGYQELIFEQISGIGTYPLLSQFSKSQIKRRLSMMTRPESGKISMLKYALILPVTAIMIIFNSCNTDKSGMTAIDNDLPKLTESPEKFPEMKGGWTAYTNYIRDNLKMPQEAVKNNVTGKVDVSFIVEENGKLTNIKVAGGRTADGKNSSNLGYGCDEEAVRLFNSMPGFTPAIYKGKPIRMQRTESILFGSQEVWDAKNPYSIEGQALISGKEKENYKKLNQSGTANSNSNDKLDDWLWNGKITNFIAKNIKYPEKWRKNNISGFVYSSFTIDKEGNIKDIKIDKGINEDFDNEVIRVLKMLPNNGPYVDSNGKPIEYKLKIPIRFQLR